MNSARKAPSQLAGAGKIYPAFNDASSASTKKAHHFRRHEKAHTRTRKSYSPALIHIVEWLAMRQVDVPILLSELSGSCRERRVLSINSTTLLRLRPQYNIRQTFESESKQRHCAIAHAIIVMTTIDSSDSHDSHDSTT